ncbi:DUF2478 domain-containing protein [Paracoccus caeni]|uniref:DUF2478 domain-containing protein n=1 Tax=Paracoccus caeni TaxID=657651 RepID=A0A934SDB9_9RHOB|nr:DUF2478 domain-containing protein [Paracoccus caeni]MBK4215618.1 DUF2478 domain-containing protein [Paracoccus caeni]
MDIRYVCSDEEHKTDAVLSAVAARAGALGIALAGTVQPVDADSPPEKCNIILGLLPDFERRSISFDLQPGMTGCRLNAEALEAAVMVVHQRLPAAQALVVNKFGKQEAAGRGLVNAIGEACERGLPVLVGVSPEWRQAFLTFAGGKAEAMPADEDAILEWLRAALADAAA